MHWIASSKRNALSDSLEKQLCARYLEQTITPSVAEILEP
jgi:hypothetical protein